MHPPDKLEDSIAQSHTALEILSSRGAIGNSNPFYAFLLNAQRWTTRLHLWPYITCALFVMLAKLPTLTNNTIFIDEPAYLVEAQRLDSFGAFVYSAQYLSETKLPLGLVPYIAALQLSKTNAMLLVHLFGLVALIGSSLLLVAISRRAFDSVIPGLFSVLLWAIFMNRDVQTSATVLEVFQAPLVLLGCWFFLCALTSMTIHNRFLAISGMFIGLAILVKPPAVALLPVLIIALSIKIYSNGSVKAMAIALSRSVAWLLVGAFVPIAIFILPYLLNPPAFAALKFNLLDLTKIYATTSSGADLLTRIRLLLFALGIHLLILIVLSLFAYPVIKLLLRIRRTRSVASVAVIPGNPWQWLLLACSIFLFLAYSMGQNKNHYLIPIVPLIMLVVGYRLLLLYRQPRTQMVRHACLLVFVLSFGYFERDTFANYWGLFSDGGQRYAREAQNTDVNVVVQYIKSNSNPQDSIWVYYNAPEIYWLSDRKPSTADPFASWLIDNYNSFWFDRTYQELEAENVQLIIGLDQTRYPRKHVDSVREIPRIKDLIAQSFVCDDQAISNVVLCKRK